MSKIVRTRLPQYNSSKTDNILAKVEIKDTNPIIDVPSNYTCVVESLAVDLYSAPLNLNPNYGICVESFIPADSTPLLPLVDIPEGKNYYYFKEPVYNINQVLDWMHEIFSVKAAPYNLGKFELTLPNELFSRFIPLTTQQFLFDDPNDIKVKVYFNEELAYLLEGLCSETEQEFNGEMWYQMDTSAGDSDYKIYQPISYYSRLCTIESLMFLTDLPITLSSIYNPSTGLVERRNVLATVEFNPETFNLTKKSQWRYVPAVIRHYSLEKETPVYAFSVQCIIQYVDGTMRFHYLEPFEKMNLNLVFYPK